MRRRKRDWRPAGEMEAGCCRLERGSGGSGGTGG